jgi:protein-tyrosine phosphatase
MCGLGFATHGRHQISENDVRDYFAHLDSLQPCNLIWCPKEGSKQHSALMGHLYLGSKAGCSQKQLAAHNISAIAQCAGGLESFFPSFGRHIEQLKEEGKVDVMQLGWTDSPEFSLLEPVKTSQAKSLREGVAFVEKHLKSGRNVLVNCAQGKSRSASLVIACLLEWKFFPTFETALAYVKCKRSLAEPNAGFRRQLLAFAEEVSSCECSSRDESVNENSSSPNDEICDAVPKNEQEDS